MGFCFFVSQLLALEALEENILGTFKILINTNENYLSNQKYFIFYYYL